MKLALAQLRIEPGDFDGNVERARDAIRRAGAAGADLVALPELFTVGYFAFDRYERSAEGLDGETLTSLASEAETHGIALLAGSVVEDLAATATVDGADPPAEEGLANTAVLFDADGRRRAVYRKRHLFGHESSEAALLTPGTSAGIADICGLTVGITTCYDLRFPEQYRALLDRGAELVIVPSAWPYPRLEHWQVLPRARAIENLLYVAPVNGIGSFDEATLLGRSTVYDPWGTPIGAAGDEPTLLTADIDPATVRDRRTSFPAVRDRLT